MRLAPVLFSLIGALLPLPPVQADAALQVPPMNIRQRVLGNGLTVLSVEDHGSPTTAIQVWYRVGAKDDPQGRSGFAHLFEHLMFKRTKYLADEQFDRLTEDVGGANNAATTDDSTRYLDVVPSNHLERLLWAEAERLQHLRVDDGNFHSERAVVEEEFRAAGVQRPSYGITGWNILTLIQYATDDQIARWVRPALDQKAEEAVNAMGAYIAHRVQIGNLKAPALEVDDE